MDTGLFVLSKIHKKSECWVSEEDACILNYTFNTEFPFLHVDFYLASVIVWDWDFKSLGAVDLVAMH